MTTGESPKQAIARWNCRADEPEAAGLAHLSAAEQLRLHRRAVQVLMAIEQIEATLKIHPKAWFRAQPAKTQARALDDLQAIDDLTFETEARLALCPLKAGGAR